MDEFRLVISMQDIDVACLTETWLSEDIEDEIVNIHGYNIVRCDRTFRRGGGTAIYIRDHIQFNSINIKKFCLTISKEHTLTAKL